MISVGTILVFILVGVIAYYLFRPEKNGKLKGKIPDGPKGWPIIGNMFEMDRVFPFLTFNKWVEQYGDIYRVKMGPQLIYVFSDYKMAKELFSSDAAFAGRPDVGDATATYHGNVKYGLIHTEGEHWEQLRRFTLRQLRDFGFGKNTMEALIMEELQEILDWMKEQEGKPVDNIRDKMSVAAVNSLWTIISGKKYRHDDNKIQYLVKENVKVIAEIGKRGMLVFLLPRLARLIPEWSGYKALRKVVDGFGAIFEDALKEHKETYSEDFQRDFIDVFLKEIKECKDPNSAFSGEYGERQLVQVIGDLFQAGADTSSTTMGWTFLYLSTFPEFQKKLQEQIHSVTGGSRPVSLSDRPSLPYAEAVLSEVLRFSTITPAGVPHKCTADRVFRGYFIPKGAGLFLNMHHIHKCSSVWGDPQNFRPERFIDPSTGSYKKHDALMPFSIGRRQCAGETLARDTLFLYLTNIFQRFNVKLDSNSENPGLDPRPGALMYPKPFSIIFTDRQS